jgi:hypothetical protein
MLDGRLQKLITRLLAKINARELTWHEGVADGEFQVNFTSYSVNLLRESDRHGSQVIVAIIGPNGTRLEGVDERSLRVEGFYDVADQLGELYNAARQQALRVDEAIDELLQHVG